MRPRAEWTPRAAGADYRKGMTGMDEPIVVRHRSTRDAGEFVAESGGRRVGSLRYSRKADAAIVIDHVFVVPEARGGRVARTLVDAAVALARHEQAHIIPVCRYARVVLRRNALATRANS